MKATCIYWKCNKINWDKWKVKEITKENENICNKIACSEAHFISYWNDTSHLRESIKR